MKGWIRKTCAGCVVALALGAPWAHAEAGGTIAFVGAILAPTCSAASAAAPASGSSFGGCGVATEGSSLHASLYRQDVKTLEHVVDSQDRLLVYFAGYAGANTPVMTRTYE